jgi:uncharacterized protein (DUF305 family)
MRPVLLLAFLALAPACANRARTMTTPAAERPEARREEASPYDAQAIDAMVAYANFTKDLADVGASRAQHPELKVFAQNLANQQSARIDQLQNWRKLWFGSGKPAVKDIDEASRAVGVAPYRFGVAWKGVAMQLDPKHPEDVKSVTVVTGSDQWTSNQLLTALKEIPDPAFDAFYTATLIEHERWGLDASKTALPQVQHPELKTMVRSIADENALNVKQIALWRDDWFGAQTPEAGPEQPQPSQQPSTQ